MKQINPNSNFIVFVIIAIILLIFLCYYEFITKKRTPAITFDNLVPSTTNVDEIPLNGETLVAKRTELIDAQKRGIKQKSESKDDKIANYYIQLIEREDFQKILKRQLLEDGSVTLFTDEEITHGKKLNDPKIKPQFKQLIKKYKNKKIYVTLNEHGVRFDIYRFNQPTSTRVLHNKETDQFEVKFFFYTEN